MLQTSEIQMNAIRRYELALVPVQRIDLPSSSKILNVQVENDIPYLHVIIYNPKTSLRKREIITDSGMISGGCIPRMLIK